MSAFLIRSRQNSYPIVFKVLVVVTAVIVVTNYMDYGTQGLNVAVTMALQ
jgi:hypothetical protein